MEQSINIQLNVKLIQLRYFQAFTDLQVDNTQITDLEMNR